MQIGRRQYFFDRDCAMRQGQNTQNGFHESRLGTGGQRLQQGIIIIVSQSIVFGPKLGKATRIQQVCASVRVKKQWARVRTLVCCIFTPLSFFFINYLMIVAHGSRDWTRSGTRHESDKMSVEGKCTRANSKTKAVVPSSSKWGKN